MNLHEFVNIPVVRGALSGILAAAAVDLHAFYAWKSFGDVKAYSWGTASFRWLQGAVMGALAALGLGAL